MRDVTFRKTCRICNGRDFLRVLDLGTMPPANSFLPSPRAPEKKFPLVLYLCKTCKLLQLRHVVNPALLFRNYHYETGASAPLVAHFKELAEIIAAKHLTSSKDLVVEIGSNDGSLLEVLKDSCRVLGVDPALRMAKLARAKGVPTLTRFFNTRTVGEIQKKEGKAAVIIGNNVLAHIDDLREVFRGIHDLLTPKGRAIFEVHWVGNLLHEGGFDQIYHEHLVYYSLHTIRALLTSLGLVLLDVELIPIHGQSLRVHAGLRGPSSRRVTALLRREKRMGLLKDASYTGFGKKVAANRSALLRLILNLKKKGFHLSGYGAPAKGNTLLNYFNIDKHILDYITDTTPSKQGTYTPGTHIPIVSPDRLRSDAPDYLLLLSWNYAQAILKKEKRLRKEGVKFIIPVPRVKVQ